MGKTAFLRILLMLAGLLLMLVCTEAAPARDSAS